MKKIIILFLSILLLSIFNNTVLAKSKVKYLSFNTEPTMKTIKISWKNQSNIKYYKIYRKDVTKYIKNNFDIDDLNIKKNDYKKLKRIKPHKKRVIYKDKNVKSKHYYAYIVEGYNKKDKLKYSSYEKGAIEYDCPSLGKPYLFNDGTGEFHTNTNKVFYFYPEVYNGIEPSYFILYRKEQNEKKYKKIGTFKNSDNKSLKDSKIKKGKIYYYKIRSVKQRLFKKYYSQYSNVIRIANVNIKAKYKLKTINKKDNSKIIKLSSNKGNGIVTLNKNLYCDSNNDIVENTIKINTYSKDNKYWKNVSKKGVHILPKQSIYLNISGKYLNSSEILSCYEGIYYDGPYNGQSEIILDFSNNKAEVKQFYD